MIDNDRIESEESQSHQIATKAKEKSAIPNSYTTELTQSFNEYK